MGVNLNTYTFGRSKVEKIVGGFLFNYPDPVVALSLQQLTIYNNGREIPLLKVRRESDNNIIDVTAIQINDGTLTSFSNGGDVYVDTWYDQSGRDNHAIQPTPDRQPLIVKNGLVTMIEGKPAIDFNTTTSRYLYYVYILSTPISSYIITKQDTASSYVYLYGSSQGQITSIAILGFNGNFIRNFITAINQSLAIASKGDYSLYTIIQDNTNSIMKRNNTILTTTNKAYGTSILENVYIGGMGVSAGQFQGKIQEVLTYDVNKYLTTSTLEENINNRYTIY